MQCYTELLPPTAVTHAVALPFLGPTARNLVVAKTSLLQVFDIKPSTAQNGKDRLTLIGEYPLSGTVTSMARVKTLDTKTGGEALLLAFKDAKLSLIDWDQENYRTSTISIHYYEGDNVTSQPFGPSLGECDAVLTVDPSSRCAGLKFDSRLLAILPFRQFGDDLVGDDEEPEENGMEIEPTTAKKAESSLQDGDGQAEQTPYKASFVLPLTALDPSLSHTVHLAFLYEYREPTFGILSAQVEPSATLLDERKDILTYTVYTLDLEQRASTNLITVPKLPSSLWKVVPLPLPIGGSLLIGQNELVHIDQSGKVNATAVNEFAKLESDLGMADQSHVNLKLEDCSIEILDSKTGELLLVLRDGSLATISFQMLGRSISAVNVTCVSSESGATIVQGAPSCVTKVDSDKVFVGSEDGNSVLLGWTTPAASLGRKRSHAQMLGQAIAVEAEDEDAIEEDDDDLYDAAPEAKKRAVSSTGLQSADTKASFQVLDHLPSIGPINDICSGRSGDANKAKLQLLAATGRQSSSRLTCMHRDIVARVVGKGIFEDAQSMWAISTKSADAQDKRDGDNLLFVFDGQDTKPYDISRSKSGDGGYTEHAAPEFEQDGETLDVQSLANGKIVVQCRRSEIRTYDSNLALNQIIPMVDDETDAEFNIVHISVFDPYVLVIRDDSSVQILQVQGNEIEPLEGQGLIVEKKWISGCIYSGSLTNNEPAVFMLGSEGSMQVFDLPDLKPMFAAPSLPHLPPILSADAPQRRGPKESLTELLIADLGESGMNSPYLVLRTAIDDIILYEPFRYPQPPSATSWHTGLRLRKVPLSFIPKYNETISAEESNRPSPLRSIHAGGYKAVTIPGAPPCLIVKEASSSPKVLELRTIGSTTNAVSTLSPICRPDYERGFLMLDSSGEFHECLLPPDTWYGAGWSVQQIQLNESGCEVRHLAYHETRALYVVATCRLVEFYFAEEDGRHPDQDGMNNPYILAFHASLA